MSDPLEVLRRELATDTRQNEHLVIDSRGWGEADKRAALALLLEAARRGDTRVPEALCFVVDGRELEAALDTLVAGSDAAMRVEALRELHARARGRVYASVRGDIIAGRLAGSGVARALSLLFEVGEASGVMALLDATLDEATRTEIIDGLWRHGRLDLYPTPGWAGLGAFRRALLLPFASFRAPLVERFKRILMTSPLAEGFPVRAWEAPSAALRAAMTDIDRGAGPVPTGAGLTDEERHALVLHAAEQATRFGKARALEALAALTGPTHRDVLEWASTHVLEPMRRVAESALAQLAQPA